MKLISRVREYAAGHGTAYTVRRCAQKAAEIFPGTWHRVWKQELPTPAELSRQRSTPPAAGLISVIIPVYNTREKHLRALLDSLRAQSYDRWEAVLYDGASTKQETLRVLDAAAEDPRFRVIHAKENRGIAGNTNAAAALARGAWFVLCDHDDLLSPEALFRVAETAALQAPDLMYSDEDRLTEGGLRHIEPFFKPDYCPDTLYGDNYICHLAAVRREIFEQTGGLREGYDGSQDHEFFLRIAESTENIVHIPRVLYSWRRVRSSASRTNLRKCLDAACRAAEDSARRRGRPLTAAPVHQALRLWYEIPHGASVRVILFGESESACRACLRHLEDAAPWPALSAVFVTDPGRGLFAALNRAAAESRDEYLLFLDARCRIQTRSFFRELLMYAQREDVGGVTPVLTDERNRILHGGFAIGVSGAAQGINTGLYAGAGGWHDEMNKTRNVSALSLCCAMVRRDLFLPFDEGYASGLGAVDACLRQTAAGRRMVYTPHAKVVCPENGLLLPGTERDPEDLRRFEAAHGTDLRDPCYGIRFRNDRADFSWR